MPTPLDPLTGAPLGFRFSVVFLIGGVAPNPIDIRFQRVSGLGSTIELTNVGEGGQNLYTHRLPKRVGYQNLVLERGFVFGSPLNIEFNLAMSTFTFVPSNVIVSLLDEAGAPLSAWLFLKAYPVRWATSDLNAAEERIVIDTMELAYTRMQALRI
jgi:phage tail-like protein